MQKKTYKPGNDELCITVGKTTFEVSSFFDTQATVTAEELIISVGLQ